MIEPSGEKGKSYAEWQAEKEGRLTWRTAIRVDIREAVAESFTWKQFISRMEKRGYEFVSETDTEVIAHLHPLYILRQPEHQMR